MAQDVTLTVDGLLLNWLKDVGDAVSTGDIIAEFEADKATVEVEAPGDGVILELKVDVGEELSEGAVIAVIGDKGEGSGSGGGSSSASDTGANDAADGDAAQQPSREVTDEGDVDNVDSAKTDGAAGSDSAGKQGDAAPQADSEPYGEPPVARGQASDNGMSGAASGASMTEDGRVKISPLARRIAEEKGFSVEQIQGSGPGGRIVRADVESFEPGQAQPAASAQKQTATEPAAATQQAPAASQNEGAMPASYGKLPEASDSVQIEDVSRMRRAIAEGTVRSIRTTPHFNLTVSIDVGPLLALRKELNSSLDDEGVKISVNDMIVKATALTLRSFPNLNSHWYGDKIVRYKNINVGISVALPDNGLVNVVSLDADKITLSELAVRHADMYERVRGGKIRPEDIRGATFTISNLGPFGIDQFSAIISTPEAGMLAIGSARKTPVVMPDDSIGIKQIMNVTLSIDHRVSDGAEGSGWLKQFRNLIENPMRLLI